MAFVTDNFTDTDNTDLASHTSDSGATYTKRNTGTLKIVSNALCKSVGAGDADGYYCSASPATADYDVQATFSSGNVAGTTIAMALRMSTSAKTEIFLRYNNSVWELYESVTGTVSSLGTYSGDTLTVPRVARLSVVGTAVTVYIGAAPGTSRITATTTVTAAGRPGFVEYFADSFSDRNLDAFTATDAAAATSPLRRNSSLNGLGASGPFFHDPLA